MGNTSDLLDDYLPAKRRLVEEENRPARVIVVDTAEVSEEEERLSDDAMEELKRTVLMSDYKPTVKAYEMELFLKRLMELGVTRQIDIEVVMSYQRGCEGWRDYTARPCHRGYRFHSSHGMRFGQIYP